MSLYRRGAALFAALTLTAALAACGSSAGDTDSTTTESTPSTTAPAETTETTETTGAEEPAPDTSTEDASTESSSETPAPSDEPEGTAPEEGAYPVTIDSALGSITLTEQPQRIATWGWSAQDNVLALGFVPVAMPNYLYGGNEDQVLPWVSDAVKALGAETPTLLDSDSDQIPFEQFLAADPDLIVAPYSGLTQEDYDRLSQIAPVVAYPNGPWGTPWQDQLTITGKALGLPAKAAALKDEMDAHIAELAKQHPALQGKTFVFASADETGLNVYRVTDPRVELLAQLGMTVSPSVAALDSGVDPDNWYFPLSYERLSEIDADVFVSWFGNQDEVDEFTSAPAVKNLKPVAAGHFAPIVGESYVMAVSAPSALAIPWMLDRFVPELAKAAGE